MRGFLKGVAEHAADGCLVKPLMIQAFLGSDWRSFDLFIEWSGKRVPDRWFHPSTHPLQDERDLVAYMSAATGRAGGREDLGWTGTMATKFGTVMHEVTGVMLDGYGITVPLPQEDCRVCGKPRPKPGRRKQAGQCGEHGVLDEATRSRGHMDKILHFSGPGNYGYDFKTRYGWGLNKVPDMDLEFFRKTWPQYYAQGQEYMRLSGLRKFIVLIMTLGSPWEFREFHFDYDPAWCAAIEVKYRRVLAATGAAA